MTMRDTTSAQDVAQSIGPASLTAATDGTGVDLQGFDGAMCIVEAGDTLANADNTFDFVLQESDDNSAFSAVNARDLVGSNLQVNDGNKGTTQRQGYIGTKRYLRWRLDAVGGTGPSVTACASVVRGLPGLMPVAGI